MDFTGTPTTRPANGQAILCPARCHANDGACRRLFCGPALSASGPGLGNRRRKDRCSKNAPASRRRFLRERRRRYERMDGWFTTCTLCRSSRRRIPPAMGLLQGLVDHSGRQGISAFGRRSMHSCSNLTWPMTDCRPVGRGLDSGAHRRRIHHVWDCIFFTSYMVGVHPDHLVQLLITLYIQNGLLAAILVTLLLR